MGGARPAPPAARSEESSLLCASLRRGWYGRTVSRLPPGRCRVRRPCSCSVPTAGRLIRQPELAVPRCYPGMGGLRKGEPARPFLPRRTCPAAGAGKVNVFGSLSRCRVARESPPVAPTRALTGRTRLAPKIPVWGLDSAASDRASPDGLPALARYTVLFIAGVPCPAG